MKFKKRYFTRKLSDSETVEFGLTSEHFGIYKKEKEKKKNPNYGIIHLPTKYAIPIMFGCPTLRAARRIIERLETEEFPVSWDFTDPGEAVPNGEKTKEVIKECIREEHGRRYGDE